MILEVQFIVTVTPRYFHELLHGNFSPNASSLTGCALPKLMDSHFSKLSVSLFTSNQFRIFRTASVIFFQSSYPYYKPLCHQQRAIFCFSCNQGEDHLCKLGIRMDSRLIPILAARLSLVLWSRSELYYVQRTVVYFNNNMIKDTIFNPLKPYFSSFCSKIL